MSQITGHFPTLKAEVTIGTMAVNVTGMSATLRTRPQNVNKMTHLIGDELNLISPGCV